jgi:hypothetical protein
MLQKSCSSSYIEHNKIEFAIFGFFYDFILNLKVAAITHKGGKNHFACGPWKDLWVHNKVLGLHKTPRNHLEPYNVALGAWGGSAGEIPATSPATSVGKWLGRS